MQAIHSTALSSQFSAPMNPLLAGHALYTRRQFFGRSALGVGTAALASLLGRPTQAASPSLPLSPSPSLPNRRAIPGLPDLPHFAPKAKRVIYLFQNGAPSHVDLFDYKPKLREWHGRQIPDEVAGGKRFSTMTGNQTARPVLGEISKFSQHGKSGAWVSDFLPQIASISDDLCFVKSLHTEAVNHAPAITYFLTAPRWPAALRWARGSATDSAAKPKTSPPSS